MSNVWACGKLDESHEISIMKEILKGQPMSAIKSATEHYSCFTLKPNLTRELCSVSACCSAAGVGYSSHITQSSLPSYERSHHSLSLLCYSLVFGSLSWVVLSMKASQAEFVLPVGEGRSEKRQRWFFQLLLVESHTKFRGFIGSLGVSEFVLIYSWLIWGHLVAGLCSLRCLFQFEYLWTAHSWRSGRLELSGERPARRLHSMASFTRCLGPGYQWQNRTSAGQRGSASHPASAEPWRAELAASPCHTGSPRVWEGSRC